jgi:hypothetical protein
VSLRSELRDAVATVATARDHLDEARNEVTALEKRHRALYEARHAALEALSRAENEAKTKRLVLYHLAVKDGEWSPGENLFGLAVEQRHVWEYDDHDAINWLITQLITADELAWKWLEGALEKNRAAFETMLRRQDRKVLWTGLREKREPRVTIAQAERLGAQYQRTLADEEQAADAAADALADLAARLAREQPEAP